MSFKSLRKEKRKRVQGCIIYTCRWRAFTCYSPAVHCCYRSYFMISGLIAPPMRENRWCSPPALPCCLGLSSARGSTRFCSCVRSCCYIADARDRLLFMSVSVLFYNKYSSVQWVISWTIFNLFSTKVYTEKERKAGRVKTAELRDRACETIAEKWLGVYSFPFFYVIFFFFAAMKRCRMESCCIEIQCFFMHNKMPARYV